MKIWLNQSDPGNLKRSGVQGSTPWFGEKQILLFGPLLLFHPPEVGRHAGLFFIFYHNLSLFDSISRT